MSTEEIRELLLDLQRLAGDGASRAGDSAQSSGAPGPTI